MASRSPFLWITELLCRLAGIDMAVQQAAPQPPPTPPAQIEALLLQELSDDTAEKGMVLVHFAPIVEPYAGRREHIMGVLEANAAAAFAGAAAGVQPAWVAETLVVRFTELPEAIDAVMALASRLLGADFDPSQLPARLLVQQPDGPVFEDLWPQPAAQERLARRLPQAVADDDALSFDFRPLWNIATEHPTGVICVPRLGGVDLTTDKLSLSETQAAAIDAQVVEHVAEHLVAAAGGQRFVGIPVHQTTLTDPALRKQALGPYMALPEDARAQAMFEVVAIGADCSRLQLGSALKPLKRAAKTVLGRFHVSHDDFSDLKTAGFAMVGTDISMSQRAEAELLPLLSDFAAAANAAHLATYVQGLTSVSLKTAAQSAGFDTVAGSPLADPLADDLGAFPFSFAELYGNVAAAVA